MNPYVFQLYSSSGTNLNTHTFGLPLLSVMPRDTDQTRYALSPATALYALKMALVAQLPAEILDEIFSYVKALQPSLGLRSRVTCFKAWLRAYSIVTYPPYPYLLRRAALRLWRPVHLSQPIRDRLRLVMWASPTPAARDSSRRRFSNYSRARCTTWIDSPSSLSTSMAQLHTSCSARRSSSRSSSRPVTLMQHSRPGCRNRAACAPPSFAGTLQQASRSPWTPYLHCDASRRPHSPSRALFRGEPSGRSTCVSCTRGRSTARYCRWQFRPSLPPRDRWTRSGSSPTLPSHRRQSCPRSRSFPLA